MDDKDQSAQPVPALDPNEPLFILRGSDPAAPFALLAWACIKDKLRAITREEFAAACMLAGAMEQYAKGLGQDLETSRLAWIAFLNDTVPQPKAETVSPQASGEAIH